MRRLIPLLALIGGVVLAQADPAAAASISLRRQAGADLFTAKVGEQVEMELAIDAGQEQVTGLAVYLSFDPQVFRLVPVAEDTLGRPLPFAPAGWLGGIQLLNRYEQIEGDAVLGYAEATGIQRRPATGAGVVARFRLEVLRRPEAGGQATVQVEERGHDRVSHYLTADRPGVEHRFTPPLGLAAAQVVGFRILPLPDLRLVSGEPRMVFDLDEYVDQPGAQVIWTTSRLPEIDTRIDPETNQVTMRPQDGMFGERRMIFQAFETGEGLTIADTVGIAVYARPHLEAFPDSIVFDEDTRFDNLDLDAFATDLDDASAALSWSTDGSRNVQIRIDPNSHIAQFRAAPDWSGQETVRFAVTDPQGLQDTASTVVLVLPIDDPPQAVRHGPVYPVLGQPGLEVPWAQLVTDVDDAPEALTYALQVEGGIQAQVNGGRLTVEGLEEGRGVVHYTARDRSGGLASDRLVVVVLPPAGSVRPHIRRLPELRFANGAVGTLDLGPFVEDDSPDSALTWTAPVPGDSLKARVDGATLVVNAGREFAGSSYVILQVTDPQGNQDQALLSVKVLPAGQDPGPQIVAPGMVGVAVGQPTQLSLDSLLTGTGLNPAGVQWDAQVSPGLVDSLDAENRHLLLSAPAGQVTPGSLVLRATDPFGQAVEVAVPVLVALPGGAPAVRSFDDVALDSLEATATIDLNDYAFDAEDAASELLWSVEAGPGIAAELDPVNHLLRLRRIEGGDPPPEASQVLLRVTDTAGQQTAARLEVQLPPVFALREIPPVSFYAGQIDTSLALDSYVSFPGRAVPITWSVGLARSLDARIDPTSHRVRLQPRDPAFQGSEMLAFTARDATGRSRVASVKVTVKGRGLVPQIRALPDRKVQVGAVDTSLKLDEYVVDDDPDSLLQWVATGARTLRVEIDPGTRVLALGAETAEPGVETIELLVRDPAGNTALQTLAVQVMRGGAPPQMRSLPQVLLAAGGGEERLNLDAYASDPDTPVESLTWVVSAEPGVSARLQGHVLLLAVPAGPSGARQVRLWVTDPEGNEAAAILQVQVRTDAVPPRFSLQVQRHPLFSDLLELRITPSKELAEAPRASAGQQALEVEPSEQGGYVTFVQVPVVDGEQRVTVALHGVDRGGNQGDREVQLSVRWMDQSGGSLREPGGKAWLNVPDAVSGPGGLAVLRRLDPAEAPAGAEGQPVFEAGLLRGSELPQPVTLCLALPDSAADLGLLHWNEQTGEWDEVPTEVDPERGQLSASVDRLGLFRLGPVASGTRRPSPQVSSYPNPFPTAAAPAAQIEYQVYVPGSVRLEILDALGQRVRTLVDSPFQDVGTWNAQWDGRDAEGRRVAAGVYFGQLHGNGRTYTVKMVVRR